MSNATINRSLAALRRMFNLARRVRRLRDVPYVPMLKEPAARKGFLEHPDYVRLRDALPDYLKPLLVAGYYTGMWLGELNGLRWNQVHLNDKQIRLDHGQTKNDEPRIVPLAGELLAVLEMQLGKRNAETPPCDVVFSRGGGPVGCFREAWRNACVRSGLGKWIYLCDAEGCGHSSETKEKKCPKCEARLRRKYSGLIFHDLRRSGVRNLIRAGVSETVAMKISGHLDREVFSRYNITSERDLADAARKLDAFVAEKIAEQNAQTEAERPGARLTQPQRVQ